jgi:hypothetical protein
MKKMTNDDDHYWRPLADNMEVQLQPEYITMSLKPAIGKTWYDTYKRDCYPSDFITHKGKKFRVPKYYDKLYKEENPEGWTQIKKQRVEKGIEWEHETTPERLKTRETCVVARLDHLHRPYEG